MSIDKEQIFQFIDAHQNEMIELWRDMVNQDTYSAYKEGVDQLQNKLKVQLEADGAKCGRIRRTSHQGVIGRR